MSIIIRILITALGLLVAAALIPDIVVANLYVAIVAAIVLGLLNVLVKPVLVVFTLPITIVTLGLFIFVINTLLFMFAASFIEGFAVGSFWSALLGSLVVSIVSALANKLIT